MRYPVTSHATLPRCAPVDPPVPLSFRMMEVIDIDMDIDMDTLVNSCEHADIRA